MVTDSKETRAFGWPTGTVRAIVLFSLIGATVYSGVVEITQLTAALGTLTGTVVAYYFKREGG